MTAPFKGDFKKEKETQILLINSEIRKYDLEEMKQDIAHNVATIANNLKKSEKQLIIDEKRNIRHLEKVEHMQKTLAEDFNNVKLSLEETEKLQKRAIANFETIDQENQEEQKKLDLQVQ